MRWNIIVECVGEDGKQSTITSFSESRASSSSIPTCGRTSIIQRGKRPRMRHPLRRANNSQANPKGIPQKW